MSWKFLLEVISPLTNIVLALIGWGQYRAYKREQRERQKAELELQKIRRRGEAPHFILSEKSFNILYFKDSDGEVFPIPPGSPNLLCFFKEQVASNLRASEKIILVVENFGKRAIIKTVKLDGKNIWFSKEADVNGANDLEYFVYPFDPSKNGKEQKLELSFTTREGIENTDTYLMQHGRRFLQRIMPV